MELGAQVVEDWGGDNGTERKNGQKQKKGKGTRGGHAISTVPLIPTGEGDIKWEDRVGPFGLGGGGGKKKNKNLGWKKKCQGVVKRHVKTTPQVGKRAIVSSGMLLLGGGGKDNAWKKGQHVRGDFLFAWNRVTGKGEKLGL